LALIATAAVGSICSRRLAERIDGYRLGFALSVGPFGLFTVIDTRHISCPPWAGAQYLKLLSIVFPAFAIEVFLFAVIDLL